MDGFLITYNSTRREDITKINHYLFGRLATVKKNRYQSEQYYYPGLFEKIHYTKIANGCYFVVEKNIVLEQKFSRLINLLPASIEFETPMFQTAREHWKQKIDDESIIRNWSASKYEGI